MKRMVRRIVRHVGFPVFDGPRFGVSFYGPDGPWCASVELEFMWRGVHRWHCFFFPWLPEPNAGREGTGNP